MGKMSNPRKANHKKSKSSASSEGAENDVSPENKDAAQPETSSSSDESLDDSATNEFDPKVNAGKSVEVANSQVPPKVCRFCKKADSPEKMIDPCECKNANNQWIHLSCLARLMESTKELSRCNVCQADYKTNRFRLIRRPKSCLHFFTQNRTNFAYLIEVPLSLGFVFLLLALGLIQYEQSYKIVYLKWSIILVFLIIMVVLNHVALFLANLYQLAARIRHFQATNFSIVVEAKK